MTPDPAAVRAALAEIDAAKTARKSGEIDITTQAVRVFVLSAPLIAAARAWLEQQEASE